MIDYTQIPEYAVVLRKLLKGSLSRDHEPQHWETMLRSRLMVEAWLGKIGLELFLDEAEGYAFLKDPEPPETYTGPALPKMMVDRNLNYKATLLCVILRQRLLDHDTKAMQASRPAMTKVEMYEEMAPYFKADSNSMKFRADVDRTIGAVKKMRLLREVPDQADTYFVERLIKARISADALEEIRHTMTEHKEDTDELTV